MILAALTLASTLAVATPAVAAVPPIAERTPNLYRAPGPGCAQVASKVRQDQQEQFRQLGKLPMGHTEYAVLRQVGGCAVPAPVGYHPPMLPGAADIPPDATREDAPSNRR
ncbi:MAG TPA: hypothetical protein VGC92_14640 [Phenylobacterium sp.]|jgi:hypothetical protein